MQKMRNIYDWQKVGDGEAINFEKTNARKVRLQVNAPRPVSVDYVDTEGHAVFLARVEGADVLEFTTPGEFALLVTGGELWLHTVDGERIAFPPTDGPKFTKLIERRARNPELERMQYVMQQNFQRVIEAQSKQMAVLIDQRMRDAAAAAAQSAAASNASGGAAASKPDVKSGDGVGDAAGDGGNTGAAGAKK